MYGPRLNSLNLYLRGCAIFILACCALARAQTVNPLDFVMDNSYQRFKTTVLGNGVVFGSTDISPSSLGRTTITAASDGSLIVKTPTSVPLQPPVGVNVTSKIDKVAAAKAIGSFASKLVIPLTTAAALYTLGKELSVAFKTTPEGTTFIDEKLSQNCDLKGLDGNNFCQGNGFTSGRVSGVPNGTQCKVIYTCEPGNRQFVGGSAPFIVSNIEVPMTREEFENRIAEKSGWPATTKLADTVRDAIKAGEKVEAKPESITGPASKQIGKTTTTNAPTTATPNPTQTTKTTTANYTYNGPNVNVTTTTVTNTTNNEGDVIDNSTSTTEAPEKEQEDPCKANPDRAGCSDLDTPTEDIKTETKEVTYSKENISWAAGAQCPPPWNFDVPALRSSGNFQVRYEPLCDVANRMKPFILAGAAFVAMMIVMSGIKA